MSEHAGSNSGPGMSTSAPSSSSGGGGGGSGDPSGAEASYSGSGPETIIASVVASVVQAPQSLDPSTGIIRDHQVVHQPADEGKPQRQQQHQHRVASHHHHGSGSDQEPGRKRRRLLHGPEERAEKLEHRLGGILCCVVCFDLPKAAVYQCANGHLMCAGCFTHVLADARLRDELATCPNCRIEISKTSASRNLAVEKAVSELPAECQYCGKEFPRNSLERHEENLCDERISSCKYSRIGCPWRGPNHERPEHEDICVHPHRSGADVMEALRDMDVKNSEERKLYDNVFELLSFEKITFNDLQMKPYRTDEFVHKLFYETSRFTAFNNQWVVTARINNSQRDPTQSSERDMTYQLILKTKTTCALPLHYLILKGPFGDMKVKPRIHRFDFTDQDNESPYLPLPLPDTAECNRLLAAKAISFRLIMFLASK